MSKNNKLYEVDAQHSEVGFAVRHMVISNVRGAFNDFSGSFAYDPSDLKSFRATASIKVASIDTRNEKRDGHVRSADFFDAEKFPEIKFEATRVDTSGSEPVVYGNLTMKGISKEIALKVSPHGPVKDPWGMERAGFEGSATVNRQDWGVSWSQRLDNGGLVVSDEVKISLNVEGVRKAE